MAKANSIPVLDSSNRVISKTTPARARILIKKSKARIFSSDPFMIQLMDTPKENVMFSKGFFDFFEYFREERPVFAQNISNTIISFGFKTAYGQEESVMIPNTPKPFCLTDYVSFDRLKESMDLKKIINRVPKVFKLLTKEEYLAYYQDMADMNGTTLEEELEKGRAAHMGITDKSKLYPTTTEVLKGGPKKELNPVFHEELKEVEEQPSPQIIGLCSRVSAELDEKERMSESDLVERLMSMGDLKEVDLDYIQSHGFYKKAKTWAAKKLETLVLSKKSS